MPEKEKTLSEKLQIIQSELKAPKTQHNKFADFMYRSCEDILEAVKPLLAKQNVTLTMKDDLVMVGERYYVKATVFFGDDDKAIEVCAFAREPLSRKGMDEPQVTGMASSYARKYALNGLFAIDDAKDADSTNNGTDKPINKTLDIVEQAFFNFTTENDDVLAEGFIFDKDKFIKAIVKHFKKLPTKESSIQKILTTVKPAECIIKMSIEGEKNE